MQISRDGDFVVIRLRGKGLDAASIVAGLDSDRNDAVRKELYDTLRHVQHGRMACCPNCGHCEICGLYDPDSRHRGLGCPSGHEPYAMVLAGYPAPPDPAASD